MKRRRTHTDDGLPRATAEWTAEDWRDLHEAVEQAKARIAARHRPKDTPEGKNMATDDPTRAASEALAAIHRQTTEEVDAMLKQAVEKSGRFVVRVPKSLHASLCAEAAREGVSLNQLVVSKLAVRLWVHLNTPNPQH